MRYERGNVVVSIETIDGFGKNPGLYVGTRKPNILWKVASFRGDDEVKTFCKCFEYMIGLKEEEPKEVSGDAD